LRHVLFTRIVVYLKEDKEGEIRVSIEQGPSEVYTIFVYLRGEMSHVEKHHVQR
jgi:hypothetical protein